MYVSVCVCVCVCVNACKTIMEYPSMSDHIFTSSELTTCKVPSLSDMNTKVAYTHVLTRQN